MKINRYVKGRRYDMFRLSVLLICLTWYVHQNSVQMPENTDQKNSKYGHFSIIVWIKIF